uniref:Uncharacterized protein n=1 Tax=Lotus japonicus TaxID=34305 RepID=I3SXD8_LOTJA|nr:unknown [Lotus japonicus]
MWFGMFKSKFTWPSEHDDVVRRNFEKRGSVKMTQLMQDVRKNLDERPNWIKEPEWTQMKAYWESSSFKEKSEINKRNHAALAGASLHTGGSVPHRLHWKRMMEEKGTNPSLADFYCRTHRKEDHSWVGTLAKSAYEKYEQRKSELSLQSSTFPLGDNDEGQQSMPSELDIWVKSVGGNEEGEEDFWS